MSKKPTKTNNTAVNGGAVYAGVNSAPVARRCPHCQGRGLCVEKGDNGLYRNVVCALCQGYKTVILCDTCNGRAWRPAEAGYKCNACNNWGFKPADVLPCTRCGGCGWLSQYNSVEKEKHSVMCAACDGYGTVTRCAVCSDLSYNATAACLNCLGRGVTAVFLLGTDIDPETVKRRKELINGGDHE